MRPPELPPRLSQAAARVGRRAGRVLAQVPGARFFSRRRKAPRGHPVLVGLLGAVLVRRGGPATGASPAQSITVNFSQAMETAITGVNFALVSCTSNTCGTVNSTVSGTITWLTSSQLFFTSDVALSQNQWYGIKLTTSATDATG